MFKEVLFTGVDSVKHLCDKRKTAVVSILDYSERGSRPDLTQFAAVLTLEFEDIADGAPILMGKTLPDDAFIGEDRLPHNVEERFCTLRDARMVLDFLDRVQNDPRVQTLLVHCYAGQSRSAALAQFVLDSYPNVHLGNEGNQTLAGKNKRFYRLLGAARDARN